uniref:Gsp_33 putative toxin n=1 Tax=Gemmula speciosa TaxID=439592 RepID=A0A098LXT5_GEMSP
MSSTLVFLTTLAMLMMTSQTMSAPRNRANDIRVKGLLPLLQQNQLQADARVLRTTPIPECPMLGIMFC